MSQIPRPLDQTLTVRLRGKYAWLRFFIPSSWDHAEFKLSSQSYEALTRWEATYYTDERYSLFRGPKGSALAWLSPRGGSFKLLRDDVPGESRKVALIVCNPHNWRRDWPEDVDDERGFQALKRMRSVWSDDLIDPIVEYAQKRRFERTRRPQFSPENLATATGVEDAFRKLAAHLHWSDDGIATGELRSIVLTPFNGAYGLAGYVVCIEGTPPRGTFIVSKGVGEVIYISSDRTTWKLPEWQWKVVHDYVALHALFDEALNN